MVSYALKFPVVLGSDEIKELTLTPQARAFKGFKSKIENRVGSDGSTSTTVDFDFYESAAVAVRMSGQPPALLDKLHPADMNALAALAQSFLVSGPMIGNAASGS